MKYLFWVGVCLFLIVLAVNLSAQTPPATAKTELKTAPTQAPMPPAPPLLSPALCGKGAYTLLMNGQSVGREAFEVKCPATGGFSAAAHTDLHIPGATIDMQTAIELDASAIPSRFTAKGTTLGVATEQEVILKDGKAKITMNGTPKEMTYPTGASFLAPNLFYLIPFIAARYDTAKGGTQDIAVFPTFTMKMVRLGRNVVQAAGIVSGAPPEAFDRYNLQFGPISTLFWTDSKGRIAIISVPMQNFFAVREDYSGYLEPLRAAMASAAKAVEPDYSAPPDAAFKAEEVTVKSKDITLAGTLLLPKSGKAPFPCAVMITGSGQQTRDEPIPIAGLEKYRPFRQIAETLAAHGVAVLRVDDRGIGKSTGFDTLVKVTTFDFADDTRAQVAYLRTRKDIDAKRIALIGHSEGGVIAPLVASADPKISAIVIMAGSAKTGEDVVMDQTADLIDRNPTLTAEEKAQALAQQKAYLETIRTGGDITKLPDTVKNAWYKAFLIYDPLPTIRKVHQPILILQGALDRQVTADQATMLEKAAREAGNKDVTAMVFPDLNHLFLKAKTGSFNEYSSLSSTAIPDDVLERMSAWLQERLEK
ncbi:MAG: alpha/beta fold hydrolase [Acidobacteriia bacterium]|nr:alpha/beta fold hydrolase [Terriglobia bacterium]